MTAKVELHACPGNFFAEAFEFGSLVLIERPRRFLAVVACFFTHFPNVISCTPILRAISAIESPESSTNLRAACIHR